MHLGRVVGEGGFQRLLAIKLMHAHLAEEPEFVAMFLDEARLAASIRHPNVVGTLDVQRGPEGMFIVMDFIDGPSLARILRHLNRQQGFLDLGIGLRIVLDMLAGLHAAHELVGSDGALVQLIHRDVSPSNVLVGSDGVARITDFGIARAEARITSTRGKQLKGKLPYMAPEQLSTAPIDRRVDVYASGCVLWETLTGRRLFEGDDEAQLLAKVLSGPQERPIQLRPDVPPSIDQVCMYALERADGRYRSAAAFADALEEAAVNERLRIAPARDVGAFVNEMFPAFQAAAQASSMDMAIPELSSLGHRAIDTPPSGNQALALSPDETGSASVDSQIQQVQQQISAVRPLSSGGMVQGAGPFETNPNAYVPNTHAGALAFPTDASMRPRNKAAVTALVALGAAAVGALVVWLASGSGPDVATGAETPTTETTTSADPTESTTEPETSESSGVASGDVTAETSSTSAPATTATKTRTYTRTRTRTKTKTTATKPPPPPPPPTATSTEFRPDKP